MSRANGEEELVAGGWRARTTDDGSWTLVHPVHGQACHSSSGAWLEARERYARPCRITELAMERDEVHLLDVGTGPGWNVAAALAAVEGTGARLCVDGLESDATVLRATLDTYAVQKHANESRVPGRDASEARAPRTEPWHGWVCDALASVLARPAAAAEGVPLGPGGRAGTLRLWLGDARRTILRLSPGPHFDAVFLDPFSPSIEPDLWEPAFLTAIARRMAPGARLSTYTASLAVRAALEFAGLPCGPGPRVGAKHQGTLARLGAQPDEPFDARTARKLARRVARIATESHGSGSGDRLGGPLEEVSAGRRVQNLSVRD